ncbi:MAG: response regulator transcription factor [Bacteroidota bacterium]
MEQINVLIVEDDSQQSELIKTMLESNYYNISGVATNYQEALELFYNQSVDLIILDIFLSGIPEGITFAETISTVPGAARPFIFLTSSTDRKIFERAKLTQPFSYILKPFNELEVLYAIEMALEKFYEQQDTFQGEDGNTVIGEDFLFVKKGRALKKVNLKDIIYIEVEEKYCDIITEKEKFVILISLKKILTLLGDKFHRTHRNHIVNIDHIEQIIPMDNLIMLTAGHHATLSDKYKDLIKKVTTLR